MMTKVKIMLHALLLFAILCFLCEWRYSVFNMKMAWIMAKNNTLFEIWPIPSVFHRINSSTEVTTIPANLNNNTHVLYNFSLSGREKSSVQTNYSEQTRRTDNYSVSAINYSAVERINSTKRTIYLCMLCIGRLGNVMFQFASLLGTARLHGVIPAIPKDDRLRKIFNINIPELDRATCDKFPHITTKRDCAFDPIVATFNSNHSMVGYFQSWKFFANVIPELKKQLTFKDSVISIAKKVLEVSLRRQHGDVFSANTTFVGLHVRRGDMLESHFVKYGYNVGSKKYILRAMSYFLGMYEDVMFVVCSNGMNWTKEVVPHENATFIVNQTAEVDMAILSLCNHSIFTVGSYGWWSSWLAGGTTIYQTEQTLPGTDLDKTFNLTDYMLPEWIAINQA